MSAGCAGAMGYKRDAVSHAHTPSLQISLWGSDLCPVANMVDVSNVCMPCTDCTCTLMKDRQKLKKILEGGKCSIDVRVQEYEWGLFVEVSPQIQMMVTGECEKDLQRQENCRVLFILRRLARCPPQLVVRAR